MEKCAKNLKTTTKRTDGNRGRSPRIGEAKTMCLEGTTPQDMHFQIPPMRDINSK